MSPIDLPQKQFKADLRKALAFVKSRPHKFQRPISKMFGPDVRFRYPGGKGLYRIRVTHYTDGEGDGPTNLTIYAAVATSGTITVKQPDFLKEVESDLKKQGASICTSERCVKETDNEAEPFVWLINVRWDF